MDISIIFAGFVFVASTFYSLVIFDATEDERASKILGRVSAISYYALFYVILTYAVLYEINFLNFLFINPFKTVIITLAFSSGIHAFLLWLSNKRLM
ncbi:hypothetical protein [Evansella clarkii]|uniref:hypothetical protein n=1 Tax=Evansella clarkii TaxID=79879 RepID=UPI000B441C0B|nr:hypothetical protein [Evansella clarkii]